MAIRDIVIFLVVFGLLPFCFLRPFIGLLTWTWLSYMNPHRLTWGIAYSFPFAQIVAAATVLGLLVATLRGERFPRLILSRETVLLILLWIMFFVSTIFALRPDLAWPELSKISKILFAAFLTLLLVDDERKLKQLIVVIAISLGFFGVKGGLFSIATGGESRVYGPGGFIGGNNSLGLALNMVLPVLFFLAKLEGRVWLRNAIYAAFVLTIIAVIFTYSRGAALGLATVLGMIALSFRARTKLVLAVIAVMSVPVVVSYMPDRIVDRIDSIKSYEEDGSAQARLRAWRAAWSIAMDRPMVGGGFQIIDDKQIMRQYSVEYAEGRHAGVHSIIFELLGENGFLTAGLFLLLLFATFGTLRHVRRTALRDGMERFAAYARMLQAGLVGYIVTGLFLEMASFDMFYQFVALAVVLRRISGTASAALHERAGDPSPGSAANTRPRRHSGVTRSL